MSENNIEILRRMTSKFICGDELQAPENQVDLYTVYGAATDIVSGEGAYGPWQGLAGRFEACRISDGKMFASMKCFVPEPMGSILCEKVSDLGEGEKVEFAIIVGIKPADSKTGYEYTCSPVVSPEASSELSVLRSQALAALPAPSSATKEKTKVKKSV